ncbi:MAG: hypothetical protein RBT61_11590 [Candidatus Kapabacteria bacterium]|jgi:hypothetical protein|nr:hypothetical protein [Candidatus Kapabacteria bacterium]
MIDTIEFVLHEVNSKQFDIQAQKGTSFVNSYNQLIYERLLEYESIYIERTKDFKAYQMLENPDGSDFKRREIGRNFVMSSRTGSISTNVNSHEIYFNRVRGQIETASSDYRVNFSISENMDAITFNLSIPKYFFGNNVAQFVPQIYSERYQRRLLTMRAFATQIEFLYQRLLEFILTFFDDLSVYINLPSVSNLDLHNIEIKRLDFCYNQYFPSHEMVTDYVRAQKKIFQAKIKKNSLVGNETDSSLYYRHSIDGFYFKIYSKGEEFENNDLPKIMKENESFFDYDFKKNQEKYNEIFKKHFPETARKLNGKIQDLIFSYYKTYLPTNKHDSFIYDIDKLMKHKLKFIYEESRKILRYEMSFTRTYMSTLYKRHLFRRTCKNWKILKKNYDKIKRYDLLISQGKPNQAETFKKRHMVDYSGILPFMTDKEKYVVSEKASGKLRKDYDAYHKSMFKKHEFYLKTDNNIKTHESYLSDNEFHLHRVEKRYKFNEMKEATLTTDLLKIMINMFKDEIEFFQIKEVEETTTILNRIDKYNEKVIEKQNYYIKTYGQEKYQKLTHTQKRKQNLSRINKTRLKPIIDKLEKGESLNKIFKDLGYAKSQTYVILDDLKKFDIEKQTVKRSFSGFKPKTDFSSYYEKFFIQDYSKIFADPKMTSFDTVRKRF